MQIIFMDGQYLPTGNFEKPFSPDNYLQEQVVEGLLQTPKDNEYGFFKERGLEYPAEIKEQLENFPLCPNQTKADPNLFSGYMKSKKQLNYKPTLKLMGDQINKQNKWDIHTATSTNQRPRRSGHFTHCWWDIHSIR